MGTQYIPRYATEIRVAEGSVCTQTIQSIATKRPVSVEEVERGGVWYVGAELYTTYQGSDEERDLSEQVAQRTDGGEAGDEEVVRSRGDDFGNGEEVNKVVEVDELVVVGCLELDGCMV